MTVKRYGPTGTARWPEAFDPPALLRAWATAATASRQRSRISPWVKRNGFRGVSRTRAGSLGPSSATRSRRSIPPIREASRSSPDRGAAAAGASSSIRGLSLNASIASSISSTTFSGTVATMIRSSRTPASGTRRIRADT